MPIIIPKNFLSISYNFTIFSSNVAVLGTLGTFYANNFTIYSNNATSLGALKFPTADNFAIYSNNATLLRV